ncbi:MAG: hypothetical protein PVH85_25870 [Desulfobacterales bacterium]
MAIGIIKLTFNWGQDQFHRNVVDHLLLGESIAAPLSDLVKVVAILEAATRSLARGGAGEKINDRSD